MFRKLLLQSRNKGCDRQTGPVREKHRSGFGRTGNGCDVGEMEGGGSQRWLSGAERCSFFLPKLWFYCKFPLGKKKITYRVVYSRWGYSETTGDPWMLAGWVGLPDSLLTIQISSIPAIYANRGSYFWGYLWPGLQYVFHVWGQSDFLKYSS